MTDTTESLNIELEKLINNNEYYMNRIDVLSGHIDIVDDRICYISMKILALQKQNDFTYYCTYGKFPND